MNTTLRVDEPREILALVPYQLGFRPTRSVVLVSLRGPARRVGLVVRADLDDVADPADGPGVCAVLASHLADDGGTAAVLVVYTDRLTGPADADPQVDRALRGLRATTDVDTLDVWVVTPDAYFSPGCPDRTCCPERGRPVQDLDATQVGAQMVLAGVAVAPSREDLVRLPEVPADARARSQAAARRNRARRAHLVGDAATTAWRIEALAAWSECRAAQVATPAGAPLPPVVLGRLQAALEDVRVRDAVLVSLVPGRDALASLVVRDVAGQDTSSAVGDAVAAVVDPVAGLRPGERARTDRAILEQVASHASRRRRAPALTLLALLAWWHGDGARAASLLALVDQADPSYRLASLLRRAVDAGMPPGWAALGR
ncbi:DUF4192 domain-containing protein [Sanguibacter suaedae]|uniref:DUF4192 domain-containing protein n=1 Tax=Sanguibacter suaedae TaxID=2795737 RepID=A0A934MAH4_9MICO|nr:DUF4192 domain-containing protein [Sanguibacter suaedae]MBI9114236.1 DUF4192 domain-containing protein [Sanguibacter suaedae]